MLLKPKKPPDPLPPHLLCPLLSSMHSFSFGIHSLRSLIEHHLPLSVPTLVRWCSSPSSLFATKFGSYAPEGKPTTLPIRLRSRAVLFRTTSNCRSVSGTIGAVPLNRFANVFPLSDFQVCGLNFYSIIFLLQLLWSFSDTSLLCCCPGFGLMLLYNGLPRCYEFGYCRPLGCITWCYVLQLTMAAFCPSSGKGVDWGLTSG
uniref:Uncharacterized protein n=1 Tax=Opuntia streptacantha TaxID=393608 RepID=A0A7C9AYF2_OPUST